jgi:hypothetical protein
VRASLFRLLNPRCDWSNQAAARCTHATESCTRELFAAHGLEPHEPSNITNASWSDMVFVAASFLNCLRVDATVLIQLPLTSTASLALRA